MLAFIINIIFITALLAGGWWCITSSITQVTNFVKWLVRINADVKDKRKGE